MSNYGATRSRKLLVLCGPFFVSLLDLFGQVDSERPELQVISNSCQRGSTIENLKEEASWAQVTGFSKLKSAGIGNP